MWNSMISCISGLKRWLGHVVIVYLVMWVTSSLQNILNWYRFCIWSCGLITVSNSDQSVGLCMLDCNSGSIFPDSPQYWDGLTVQLEYYECSVVGYTELHSWKVQTCLPFYMISIKFKSCFQWLLNEWSLTS